VLTAINVLHIEELRERVERLTGKHAKTTVPKDFLIRADEIVVVDVPTDLALDRRGEVPEPFGSINEGERTLSELREMALILAAEVVEAQLEHYLEAHGIQPVSGSHERILVCLTPRSDAPAMISSGKRNKERFHGELHVVHVRQPRLSPADRARINSSLDVAREAGAEVQILEGDDPVEAILEYARMKKITQIFVGHSRRREWASRVWAGPLVRLLRGADQMDVRIFPQ
jgi:two-component system sensor histidine kinase KdpD